MSRRIGELNSDHEFPSNNRLTEARNASNNTRRMLGGQEKDQGLPCSDSFDNQIGSSGVCGNEVVGPNDQIMKAGGVSLRSWLDDPKRSVDLLECLHIFRQIVEIVNRAHSQGVVFHNARPSCFRMSPYNRISYIEPSSCTNSHSNLFVDGGIGEIGGNQISLLPIHHQQRRRLDSESEGTFLLSSFAYGSRLSSVEHLGATKSDDRGNVEEGIIERNGIFPLKQILVLELKWYTSPEEVAGASSSFSSDIYGLGVLLFELFCTFSSAEEMIGTMSNLWLRVLPPQVLLEWPKEASFCLWLLHPHPNTRPKMSDLLQSEFLSQPTDSLEDYEAAIKLREEIREQELLLEFLLQMQQIKQEMANKLHDTIHFLSSDIGEIQKQQAILTKKASSFPQSKKDKNIVIDKIGIEDSTILCSQKHLRTALWICTEEEFDLDGQWSKSQSNSRESILSKSSRVMKNFKKLESSYLSTRCQMIKPALKPMHRNSEDSSIGKGSVVQTEGSSVDNFASKVGHGEGRKGEWIDSFLDGLCKYLSFSKLKVRADLKQGDLFKSSNLVRSLSFDRDKEFFAAAGVNRKIKVFDCDAILNEDRDMHYPVAEMCGRSTVSSVCWNGYIKSHIASSNFEGVVQVWDVTRRQVFIEMREHEKRVWSVDFSLADPTNLASGSDDGVVKLWNINQKGSIATIKIKANVCSVQFPPGSARHLAIGSADHKIYYYDLRNTRIPWCTFIGHTKTVSNVRLIDSTNLVSASTDNSLKLWDLTMSTSRVVDNPIRTFTGHTNVKNFVGLSISDGYIATGSETNEVIVYHKAFPMPALSFKFDSTDRLPGHEVDSAAQFVSCVCWRGQSSTLVAANSTGNIKLLEMV